MKKGQVYEGIVERVEFPNKGIVHVGDKTCIVKNSLPQQKISFGVNKLRKGKAEGRLLEVIEKSPLETNLTCSHFGLCGGCTYLSLEYEKQLEIKSQQVKNLLDQVLSEESYVYEPIKGSPEYYEYRNKMEFSFGDEMKDGPLALGMHKRGSFYDIVTVDTCKIVDADYRLLIKSVVNYFQDKNVTFYHRLRQVGWLRHLLVRKAKKSGGILIGLVTTTQYPGQVEYILSEFINMLRELPFKGELVGVLHIQNDSMADVVKADNVRLLYGESFIEEEILGLKFQISPFSFFQTNTLGAEVLYETTREYIGAIGINQVVFDLYSGTGTIAQLMAPVAKKVIGVEIIEEAVLAARENAKSNGLDNCEFIVGDVLKTLDEIEEKPDLIILDPPRDGIHPKALPKIIEYGVEKIVYISCKPTSLVRDLEVFLANGYKVERVVAVDQFPWTANVEVITQMTRV